MNNNGSYRPVTKTHREAISKRLVASYIFDWIAIIAIAAIGGGLNFVSPQHRAFSLLDLSISFPYIQESITTPTLIVVGLIAPGVIIAAVALALTPGRRFSRTIPKSRLIRVKLWEMEKGLAGLALSIALAFFVTQGMKQIFGKPRPDMLARCKPDLANIAQYVVGGYGQDLSNRWTLVTSAICTQTDKSILDDGFRSFPSGHASWSWSGLLYLSLFLCSKFAITIPFLPVTPQGSSLLGNQNDQELLPVHKPHDEASSSRGVTNGGNVRESLDTEPSASSRAFAIQNAAAAPPNYLLILVLIPPAVAVYICSTRFTQYYHFGFDLISGSLIGIISAWFAFRWYHLPISRGHGWAWGPRSRERAFAIGVGTDGYVNPAEYGYTQASSTGSRHSAEAQV